MLRYKIRMTVVPEVNAYFDVFRQWDWSKVRPVELSVEPVR